MKRENRTWTALGAGCLCVALAACSGGGSGSGSPSGGGGGGGGGGGSSPAFSLSAPSGGQITVGGVVELMVRVTPEEGFTGMVGLTVDGLPAGVLGEFTESDVLAGDSALALTAESFAPVGVHQLTVVGRSGTLERTASVALEVFDTGFDFGVDAALRAVDVRREGEVRVPLTVDVLRGTLPELIWSVDGLPAGLTGSVVPAAVGGGDELLIEVDLAAPIGTHQPVVAATADGLRREVPMLLRVRPASDDQGITVGLPSVLQVRRGGSTAAQVELTRASGVTGAIALQIDGLPTDVIAVVDDSPVRGAVALLTFTAGAGTPLGESVVSVTGTQDTSTGTDHLLLQVVADEPLADARVQRVEFAQTFFATDPGLVGGKPAVLRAHVVAERAGVAAPVVRVTASSAGTTLGTRDLTGPSVLPTGEQPADLAQSFRTDLPVEWMVSGVEMAVEVDPGRVVADREERNDRVLVRPRVGSENQISLVIVPLRLNGRDAQPFSGHAELLRAHWPLAGVGVTIRAPYTVTSVQDVGSDGTGWSTVLGEIASLRSSDGSSAYYYGVVPVTYGGGVAGVGYIGAPIAIGWHRTLDVLLHEIGHNFGLRHAPCGGPGGVDANYPFPNGITGQWGYDARSGALLDPRTRVDLMSYCGPDWVSGYNHEKVRLRLGTDQMRGSDGNPNAGDVPLLMVRGAVGADGRARMDGVTRRNGTFEPLARGDLDLRLTFGGGRSARFAVQTAEVGCGSEAGERQFVAAVPDPGELEAIELLAADGRVLLRESTRRAPAVDGTAAASTGLDLRLEERGGALHVRWNADAWPTLSITHVGAARTTLALGLRGSATLPLDRLPAGGEFEVAAADGIDGFVLRVAR